MRWGKIIGNYALMVSGAVIFAFGFNLFLRPAGIAPGGLTGIALLLHSLIPPLPVGAVTLLLNIPLFLLGLWKLGGEFVRRTIFTTVFLSVLLDLVQFFPKILTEPLLAAIYGGVCLGAGMGLAFLPNSSTGGIDIAIRVLRLKYPQLSIGQIMLLFDAVVVIAAGLVYRDINHALYAIITMYIASLALDAILYGLNYAKAAFIITDHGDEVNRGMLEHLVRGTTVFQCVGGYSNQPRTMILCAIKRGQLIALKSAVYAVDPNAFVILSEAHEVLGYGFQKHQKNAF